MALWCLPLIVYTEMHNVQLFIIVQLGPEELKLWIVPLKDLFDYSI
jgi:hypothetical protein